VTRRGWLAVLLVAVVVIAAYAQTREDEQRAVRSLAGSWQQIGGHLVNPRLIESSYDGGLTCFAFGFGVNRMDLCFDGHGRLVERLDETPHSASATSILTSPGAARVTLSADTISNGMRVAREVTTLDRMVAGLRAVVQLCESAIANASEVFLAGVSKKARSIRARNMRRIKLLAVAESVGLQCGNAAQSAMAVRRGEPQFHQVFALLGRLVPAVKSAELAANVYIKHHRVNRAEAFIQRETMLSPEVARTMARMDVAARSARRKLLDGA
jgi:hypothetical protein